jgi:hypothetical protein
MLLVHPGCSNLQAFATTFKRLFIYFYWQLNRVYISNVDYKLVLLAISISIIYSNWSGYRFSTSKKTGSTSRVNLSPPLSIEAECCLDLSNQRAHCVREVGSPHSGRNWFHGERGQNYVSQIKTKSDKGISKIHINTLSCNLHSKTGES